MNNLVIDIRNELQNVIQALDSQIPTPLALNLAHNNWSFPGLSKADLIEQVQELIDLIDDNIDGELKIDYVDILIDYIQRLQKLTNLTIPNIWGNAGQAVPAFELTISGLKKNLTRALNKNHSVTLRELLKKIRNLESNIKNLEPRTASLDSMVSRIEQAYHAADQLPTDLETLNEARIKVRDILKNATTDHAQINLLLEKSNDYGESLDQKNTTAENILSRCESAYSASTTVGLAAAFVERSQSLSKSMWIWVVGLIASLCMGGYFGANRLHELLQASSAPNPSSALIITNLFLSILSIGAPVWFSWLATKQIGHRFKLSEDYAFKASVSRAYEGYRSEASRIDKKLEIKLLESALNRIDELPLRLIETENHGSPFQENLSSEVIKEAIKTVPGFVEKIKNSATESITTFANIKESKAASNENSVEKNTA